MFFIKNYKINKLFKFSHIPRLETRTKESDGCVSESVCKTETRSESKAGFCQWGANLRVQHRPSSRLAEEDENKHTC